MSFFGQPWALLGLLLLPLLIALYLWRAQHRRQLVSSAWLWTEATAHLSQQQIRRLPVREPLLLLQLLAVALLSVGLAQPRLGHAARLHRIVVLDASVAMTATDLAPTRFAQARRRLQELFDAGGPDDTFSLVLAGPRARLLAEWSGAGDLPPALRGLTPSFGAVDLSGAAALAHGLAGASGQGAPDVTFLAAFETPPLPLPGIPVRTERFGARLDDQGVALFTVGCMQDGLSCDAFARLRNTARAARAATLALWADDRTLGRQTVQLPASGTLDLSFAVPSGAHALHLALLGHDTLAADDSAWALVPSVRSRRVLLVSDAPGQIALALRAIPGVGLRIIPTSAYQDTAGVGQDLVVLDGASPDYLPTTSLLLLNPPIDSSVVQVRSARAFLPVTQVDTHDPIVQGLDLYGLVIGGRSVVAPPWARVAAGGSGGPLVLYGLLGGQRTAVLPFDAAHGVAAQSYVYPLLIARLVEWLAPAVPPAVTLDAQVHLPPTIGPLLDPSGAQLSGPLVQPELPGLYRVAPSAGALFSVAAAFPGEQSSIAAGVPQWSGPPAAGSFLAGIWPLVVAATLLALLIEWWFYARKT